MGLPEGWTWRNSDGLAHQADAGVVAEGELGLRVGHRNGRREFDHLAIGYVQAFAGWTSVQLHWPA